MMKKTLSFLFLPVLIVALVGCSAKHQDISGNKVTIAIASDNTILVNNESVALDNLADKLKELGCDNQTMVSIEADKSAEMHTIQDIRNVLHVAEITQVAYNAQFD